MNGIVVLALLIPMFAVSTGTESMLTILQQVRIGDTLLIPNTAMSPPIALVHPAPAYTAEALQAGIEGTVAVRAEFDIDGNARVLEVVDGLGYGLDEAALAALETWTFRPAYRSGRRVPVVANIEIEFRSPLGMFGCVGDYDGDDYTDVYVIAFGQNVLYRNNGDGTFSDVDETAATEDRSWGADCAFAAHLARP